MPNAYPELPVLEYIRTSVQMPDVVAYLASLAGQPGTEPAHITEIKRAAYMLFRWESGNGTHGVNNNYCGAQADSGRWPPQFDTTFAGTVTIKENQTGRVRIFLAFKSWHGSVDFLLDRVRSRGLYIGGTTHLILNMKVKSPTDLVRAYFKEWARGSAAAEPDPTTQSNLLSMYNQAVQLIG